LIEAEAAEKEGHSGVHDWWTSNGNDPPCLAAQKAQGMRTVDDAVMDGSPAVADAESDTFRGNEQKQ